MSKTRLDFQQFLEDFNGNRNVYYKPPPSIIMKYPATVYKLANIVNTYADNSPYFQRTAYDLTYITEDPDDPKVQELSNLPMCTFNRFFTADNLNHFNYTIYF